MSVAVHQDHAINNEKSQMPSILQSRPAMPEMVRGPSGCEDVFANSFSSFSAETMLQWVMGGTTYVAKNDGSIGINFRRSHSASGRASGALTWNTESLAICYAVRVLGESFYFEVHPSKNIVSVLG